MPKVKQECRRCGKDIDWQKHDHIYVGQGNDYCIECFVKTMTKESQKIADMLPKLRKKEWKCEKCLKKYKSKWNFEGLCDKCTSEGWKYGEMLDVGWAVHRYIHRKDKWPLIIGFDPKKQKEFTIRGEEEIEKIGCSIRKGLGKSSKKT